MRLRWPHEIYRRRRAATSGDEEGSILLLTIGYAVLALVTVLVCVDATSLYLAQKRLDSLAGAAALASADGFTLTIDAKDIARVILTNDGVEAQAQAFVREVGGGAELIAADTPDGMSARVTVRDTWFPPVITMFVPAGVTIESTATGRNAAR